MEDGGGVGELADKGPGDPGTDHPAVLIGGLGQQQGELGGAAPGGGVTPAQVAADDVLKVVHDPVQAVSGQGSVLAGLDGDEGHMEGLPAPGGHPGHGVADDAEEVVVAQQGAGVGRLLEALQQSDGGEGPGVPAALGILCVLAGVYVLR